MSPREKDNKEINFEKCKRVDVLFDPEEELIETKMMTPQEKKEYFEFLWRRRFFSC